jgi:hypothetical protein
MVWMLVCAGCVVMVLTMSGSRDGLDYGAREVRAAVARREAAATAQMRRIRWARRREDLRLMTSRVRRMRWVRRPLDQRSNARATVGVARA